MAEEAIDGGPKESQILVSTSCTLRRNDVEADGAVVSSNDRAVIPWRRITVGFGAFSRT